MNVINIFIFKKNSEFESFWKVEENIYNEANNFFL